MRACLNAVSRSYSGPVPQYATGRFPSGPFYYLYKISILFVSFFLR